MNSEDPSMLHCLQKGHIVKHLHSIWYHVQFGFCFDTGSCFNRELKFDISQLLRSIILSFQFGCFTYRSSSVTSGCNERHPLISTQLFWISALKPEVIFCHLCVQLKFFEATKSQFGKLWPESWFNPSCLSSPCCLTVKTELRCKPCIRRNSQVIAFSQY